MKERLTVQFLTTFFPKRGDPLAWLDKPVPDDILGELYQLVKWGPTNSRERGAGSFPSSACSREARNDYWSRLAPGNVEKRMASP